MVGINNNLANRVDALWFLKDKSHESTPYLAFFRSPQPTFAPEGIAILLLQEKYLRQYFNQQEIVTKKIWELIKLCVSQIN